MKQPLLLVLVLLNSCAATNSPIEVEAANRTNRERGAREIQVDEPCLNPWADFGYDSAALRIYLAEQVENVCFAYGWMPENWWSLAAVNNASTQALPRKSIGWDEACDGQAGLLSVLTLGAKDCEIMVQGQPVGDGIKLYRMSSPSGNCWVHVRCDGVYFRSRMRIDPIRETNLVIEIDEWQVDDIGYAW